MLGSKIVVTLCIVLLLGACSSEPSNEDLKQAFSTANRQGTDTIKNLTGINIGTEINSVTKISCKSVEKSTAFRCDYQLEATVPILGRQTTTASDSFIKTNEGWRILAN